MFSCRGAFQLGRNRRIFLVAHRGKKKSRILPRCAGVRLLYFSQKLTLLLDFICQVKCHDRVKSKAAMPLCDKGVCRMPLFFAAFYADLSASSLQQSMLYLMRCHLQTGTGRRCMRMENIALPFLISVMAGVVCHYLCKWLDERVSGNKPER